MYKRIFLDTNPIIYLIEDMMPFSEKVYNFIYSNGIDNSEFYTSTITDTEFLVQPYKNEDFEVINLYWDFLKSLDILKCYISEKIAVRAAKIRAKYPSIKTIDSLQLASAIESNCEIFLTNDTQLKQVTEINVLIINDIS